jgi:outer membrane protein OmpA-like peptidoglycan-associated protein
MTMSKRSLFTMAACVTTFGCPLTGAAAPLPATSAPTIPLCPGLTIVTAVSQQDGDYESIKTVESVGAEVRFKYSAEMKNSDMFGTGPAIRKLNLQRTILSADLDAATDYQQIFLDKSDETIPKTTSIGTSAEVLRALKSKGQTDFGISIAYDGLELKADRSTMPNYYSYLERGTIMRVDGPPNTLSVIVNDQPVELPVVRAQGDFLGDKNEFLFLDDPKNPLTLAFRIGIDAIKPLIPVWLSLCNSISKSGQAPSGLPGGARCDRPNGGDRDALRVVKITYRCPLAEPVGGQGSAAAGAGGSLGAAAAGSAGEVEQALAAGRKADVYSIYFSFNSDAIRDESEPTLKDLADILRRHPDWKLAVNGHTDGVGGEQFNLDLSKRRAAAVKAGLVDRYRIDASRLTFSGFGKSQPKDTNDTLEGRAKNRRVELMRL